jgi:Tfp pilus assembly protein PilN
MSIPALLEWIESTDLSTAIREGALYYPIIGGVHLLGIALFGGMVLMTDLRLLGWAMRRIPVSDIVRQLQAWKWAGFIVVAASGLLLAWAEPQKLYRSPAFWVKMALLALVGVHALVFRPRVYGNTAKLDVAVTAEAKLAAAISLILWAGLIVSGRLIAYDA